MLEPCDLSPAEETPYLALVVVSSLTVAKMAPLLTTTDDGVRPILAGLKAVGLITQLAGSPPRFCVIEPGIGFAALLTAQQQRVRKAEEQAQHAWAVVGQLAERLRLRGARHPLDLVEVVVGERAGHQRIFQLERMARKELRGIDTPAYVISENPVQISKMAEGVDSRWLYYRGALDVPGKLAQVGEFTKAGEHARIIGDAPMKLLTADDQQAIIALTGEASGGVSALMIGPSILFDSLPRLFESLWSFAVPLRSAGPVPDTDLPSP